MCNLELRTPQNIDYHGKRGETDEINDLHNGSELPKYETGFRAVLNEMNPMR